ncbi:MAG TPA: hypothetical protein VFA04_11705 [Bryobacteraceae bacterium]|jgi:hypothetical protein|nr:hypothetical protein [Bryobacteraceae bacterium]
MLLDGEYREEKTRPWYEFIGGPKTRGQILKRLVFLLLIVIFAVLKFTGIIRFHF